MKKLFISVLSLCILVSSVSAVDMVFKAEPNVIIPLKDLYNVAPGISASAEFDLFNLLSVGVEGGYSNEKPKSVDGAMNFISGGLNISGYYNPISRLYVSAGAGAGVYNFITSIKKKSQDDNSDGHGGVDSTKPFSDIYYKAFAEVGFRVNPSFTISAAGGYKQFFCSGTDFLSGPYAGISFRYNVAVGNKSQSSDVRIRVEQDTPIFPVYSSVYSTEPFGTIILRNEEGAELRNVHVSFRAGKYTTGTKECAVIGRLNRRTSIEVPLYADFSDEILKFSENGKISGEVVVDYELLGKKMSVVKTAVVDVYNKNAFLWGDSTGLAAFISPDVPEIAAYAKEITGITRANLYTGMNANLQYAAGLVEGLALSGINYSNDKVTPYTSFYNGTELDSIQYPLQTLQCLSGDYDDLGILLASCLQTVNVSTGFIPMQDDFLVLVWLNMPASQALSNFATTDGLIIDEDLDDICIALSMAHLEEGFTKCFAAGCDAVEKIFSDEENYYEFIDTTDAWTSYKPVVYSNGSSVDSPKQDELVKKTEAAIKAYISSDIEAVIARAKESGDSNKIGVALVRAGRYSDAKKEFQKAATKGSTSAMNNVANILMIERDYAGAAAQYKKVLEKSPENKTALKGLEDATSKLE